MKIVLQHPHHVGEISGVLTSINQLHAELATRPGVETRLLSTKTASWREQIAAVKWADAIMLNSNGLLIILAARVMFRTAVLKYHYPQYQTVHWHYVPMSLSRRFASELRHLLGSSSGVHYTAVSLARLVIRTFVGLVANRLCACSEFCAEQTSLPRRIHVLRNPMRIASGLPRRTVEEIDRPLRFVFIGRITRDKGWDTLVEAASRVAQTGRDFRVDVVGDGDDLDAMERAVGVADLAGFFRFFGRVEADGVDRAIAGAVAVVMPSRVQETAGYVPVEAAAQRVASIVSRVGGLPETAGPDCPNFAAGDAVQLSEHMVRYIDDPAEALAAGHAAYLRAETVFSPKLVTNELMDLLRNA